MKVKVYFILIVEIVIRSKYNKCFYSVSVSDSVSIFRNIWKEFLKKLII